MNHDLTTLAGELTGILLAPLFAAGSRLRRARFFHPEGVCYRAEVLPAADASLQHQALAARLGPLALVRLSSAWWRSGQERPDVLGVTLRFQASPGAPAQPGDQDLLLATIPVPLLTPLAPLWTNPHDFLDNIYYGTAPFWIQDLGPARVRLVPRPETPQGTARGMADRPTRLQEAVRAGTARFSLEVAASLLSPYLPVATLTLVERVEVDQESLCFSPFRDGRGITPVGFIQGLRKAVYAASQGARPGRCADPPG